MKKISSILPATSRITNVDLSDGPRRRPGAYSFIAESEKQAAEAEAARLKKFMKPNDMLTISPEAKTAEKEFTPGSMAGVIQSVKKTGAKPMEPVVALTTEAEATAAPSQEEVKPKLNKEA